MRERSSNARIFLEESLKNADIYTNGDLVQIKSKDIGSRINESIGKLIDTVYHKLSYIDTVVTESHIRSVLLGEAKNMEYRIAVCDDVSEDRNLVKKKIAHYMKENNYIFCCDEYSSGEELLASYQKQYDFVVLDVQMQGMNGIQTAKKIKSVDHCASIVFSTNHMHYAYDSFSVDPLGYVLKSETYKSFFKKFERVIKRIETKRKGLLVSYCGKESFLEIDKIVSVEYHNHIVEIFLLNGEIVKAKSSVRDLLDMDEENYLLQVNRNSIVNVMWIDICQNGLVYMRKIKKNYDVSRRSMENVERNYLNYCKKRML